MWPLSGSCSCQELMVKQVWWVMLRVHTFLAPAGGGGGVRVAG